MKGRVSADLFPAQIVVMESLACNQMPAHDIFSLNNNSNTLTHAQNNFLIVLTNDRDM